jgi:hypothetical protein
VEDSLLKPGDIYDKRVISLFFRKHALLPLSNASQDSGIQLQLNQQAGTVAITFDFQSCALQDEP